MEGFETVLARLAVAVLLGGLIGLERAHHGRPAGLRTHTLVCLSSCLLMLLTVFQWDLLSGRQLETIRVDPTRMGQGIMTGIGFLGAGVIMKEKLTIRGLTTAASIWVSASIGIIIGMGMYFAGIVATVITVIVLSMFRLLERVVPSLHYGRLLLRFKSTEVMDYEELRRMISDCGVSSMPPAYAQEDEGRFFCYDMTIRTRSMANFHRLSEALRKLDAIKEFSVTPTGD